MRFVRIYKHVGTKYAENISDEMYHRAATMSSELQRLKKHVFRDGKITIQTCVSIIKGYVFSKGCYNCGTWSGINSNAYAKYHAIIMNVYRHACH